MKFFEDGLINAAYPYRRKTYTCIEIAGLYSALFFVQLLPNDINNNYTSCTI